MDITLKGIDVSAYNGYLDWQAIKNAGIEFAMIKATHGKAINRISPNFTDKRFITNVCNANSVGILCGAYHYFTAQSNEEAINEANYFLSVINPYKAYISLWAAIYIDDETHLNKLSKPELNTLINTFCNIIKSNGYEICIYANTNFLRYKLDLNELSQFAIWQSSWSEIKPVGYNSRLAIWQYGIGKLDGINGQFSLNYGYLSMPDQI